MHVVLLSILLHGTDIDFVLSIQAVHLSEDTGHVANLRLLLLKYMLDLLLEPVIKSKSIGDSSNRGRISHFIHLVRLVLHLFNHVIHLFEFLHVHLITHAIFVVILALHHAIRHHVLIHERIIILHIIHHFLELHHHLESIHLLVIMWSSIFIVRRPILVLMDDTHHLVELVKLVGLHFTSKGQHNIDKSVNSSVGGKIQLWSINLVALGNSFLHVDSVDLHVVFSPAALHGLGLGPCSEHVRVVAPVGQGIGGQ